MNRSLEAMTLRVVFQRAARAEFDAAALDTLPGVT